MIFDTPRDKIAYSGNNLEKADIGDVQILLFLPLLSKNRQWSFRPRPQLTLSRLMIFYSLSTFLLFFVNTCDIWNHQFFQQE
jgi:hypothetical protein